MAEKKAKPVQYAVVDAFTGSPFKGNPAAVCLLDSGGEHSRADDAWMQMLAQEFNLSETAFLRRESSAADLQRPRFSLRWFTPAAEVALCGHATLASAHFLLTSGLEQSDVIEFTTKSGILTAKKMHALEELSVLKYSNNEEKPKFSIELNFPVLPVVECDSMEFPSIPETLMGRSMINVVKTKLGDLLIELPSGKDVVDVQPNFDEIKKCAARGIILTGLAPPGSGYDFFSRFFCPKLGIDEDPVCGSAHCALAPYWSPKIGKHSLIAYMASPRGGRLDLIWEEDIQRVKMKGEAVTVMEGFVVV